MTQNNKFEEKQVDLKVNRLITPVIGIEISPDVHLHGATEDSLRFEWHRKLNDKKINCCMHYWVKATFQCKLCVSLNLPIEDSYHCSSKCYKDTWIYHREHHRKAREQLNDAPELDVDECINDLENDLLVDGNLGEVDPDGSSWLLVGSSKNYTPSNQDFGCILRLDALVEDRPLASKHVFTNCVIGGGNVFPRVRKMIQLEHPMGCGCQTQSHVRTTIRVLSYNILADMHPKQKYNYLPAWALTWDYRKQYLLREIIEYQADIICLQEVQTDHFENFLVPELEARGYSVMYKSKKDGPYIGGRNIKDGCATFFLGEKFKKVREYEFVFPDIARNLLATLQPIHGGIHNWRLFKDNVAIVTVLEPVDCVAASDKLSSRFCVANTHIHSSKSFRDVKLWQVATLINALENIVGTRVPVLLCGDLNSLPGSTPYDLVRHGKVDTTHGQFPEDPIGIFPHIKLCHHLNLKSAYSTLLTTAGNDQFFEKQREMMNAETREPHFTNVSPRFSGTLDYIFYSAGKFKVRGLLELLNLEDIKKRSPALPSAEWSSDHIALMAEFCLTPQPRNYLSTSSSSCHAADDAKTILL